jgi:TonB family protein
LSFYQAAVFKRIRRFDGRSDLIELSAMMLYRKLMRFFLSFLLFPVLNFGAFGASPEMMTEQEAVTKDLLLFAVRPDYPYEALSRKRSGSGVFDLTFDYESGHLREVHVVKSTGWRVLDAHAIGALKLWKAKPRSLHTIRVPIIFTFSRREY